MIGVPDDSMGEEVGAAVVLKQGQDVTADELRAYVKERGRQLQVPAQDLVRRRAAQGPDGQDPQARDRGAGGGQDRADGRALRAASTRLLAGRRRRGHRAAGARAWRGRSSRPSLATRPWTGRAPRRGLRRPSWPRSPSAGPTSRRRRSDRRFKDDAWRGNPAFRRLAAGLPRRGQDGRRADRRRRASTGAPSGACASRPRTCSTRSRRRTSRLTQPGGAEGDARHRRAQLRAAARANLVARHGARRRASRRWSTRRRSRSARTSRSRRARSCCARRVFELIQYEPQHAEGARDAAAARPADDQQVLRRRPRAGPQHDRVLRRRTASRCFAISWRNPDERHADWGLDDLRAARCSRRSRRSRRSRAPTRRT